MALPIPGISRCTLFTLLVIIQRTTRTTVTQASVMFTDDASPLLTFYKAFCSILGELPDFSSVCSDEEQQSVELRGCVR